MFRRLVAPLREFGLLAGLAYLTHRLLRAVSPGLGFYVYELMMQPVHAEPLLPKRMLQSVQFVEMNPGHPDLAQIPVPDAIQSSRFAQGAQCLGVYRKGMLIGYCWFCFGAYQEDEVRCSYDLSRAQPAAWDFDLYVFPEHRMGIGFPAVWHGAFEYLRARGIERSYSRVTQFNLASRRAHARLGSVRIGRVVVLKLWHAEIALATVAPYVGATCNALDRTLLKMPALRKKAGASDTRTERAAPERPRDRLRDVSNSPTR